MSKITTDLNTLRAQNKNASVKEANDIVKKLEVSLQESETEGVGLAAPQIGINKRVAIVRVGTENIDLVNPTIIEKEDGFVNFGEGCLSIPGERLNTQRYKQIFVVDDLRPNGFVAVGDVAIVIQHECLPGKSRLLTPNGDRTILDIVNNKYNGKVLSIDKDMNVVWDKVVGWQKKRNTNPNKKRWVSLKFSYSSPYRQLCCTSDHLCAYVEDPLNPVEIKYIEAENIVGKFQLRRAFKGIRKHEVALFNRNQVEALIGMLLGDLHISKVGEPMCNHGEPQSEYSIWKSKIFNGYIRPGYSGYRMANSNICCHMPVNEQTRFLRKKVYVPDKKIVKEIIDNFSVISAAFWYMDDGSLSGSNTMCKFHTEGFPLKEQANLCDLLWDKLQVKSYIKNRYTSSGKLVHFLSIPVADTSRLHQLIAPYIHPSMRYKIIPKYRDVGFNEISSSPLPFSCRMIGEIKYLNTLESALYNIQTENNNCFFAEDSLVHNCDHLDGILITDRVVGKSKVGRNDPCPCGKIINGKPVKYKKCHGR